MDCCLRVTVMVLVPGLILFGSAGRFDLPFFWAYVGSMLFFAVLMLCVIDRDLLRERAKPAPGGVDRRLRILAAPLMIGHWALAGLDVGRWHVSDTIPFAFQLTGITALCFGMAISVWAIRVNAYFSPVVRIQSERGHHVIDNGPYAIVRHPGYLGSSAALPLGAFALGSWLALIPIFLVVPFLVRRIVIEDRFLHENLNGYREYAQRVRFRIIPGVW